MAENSEKIKAESMNDLEKLWKGISEYLSKKSTEIMKNLLEIAFCILDLLNSYSEDSDTKQGGSIPGWYDDLDKLITALNKFKLSRKIDDICQNYLILNAICIIPVIERIVKAYPLKFLNDFVGLKIPEDYNEKKTTVVFDEIGETRWPGVYVLPKFEKEEGARQYSFKEAPSKVIEDYFSNKDSFHKVINRPGTGRLVINVPEDKNNCQKIIVLPWFSTSTELLTEYHFADDKEPAIILTTGC